MSKITRKLILYFTITLLILALIIGVFFTYFYSKNLTDHHTEDILARAENIAAALESAEGAANGTDNNTTTGTGTGSGEHGHGHNYGSNYGYGYQNTFLRIIDDISDGDVWIVGSDMNQITVGHDGHEVAVDELPAQGKEMIQAGFKGESGVNESFSPFMDSTFVTAAAPVYYGDEVVAVVLLHSPVRGVMDSIKDGLSILAVSIFVAMILSIIVAVILSRKFVSPIKRMTETSKDISAGDYDVKTGIYQNDEIGELASTIDVMAVRLNEAAREQDKLSEMREEFFADVSHELRTPVTVIMGYLEILRDKKIGDEKVDDYYLQMLNETKHMQKLINDLLELSRLRNRDFSLEFAEVNIIDVLSDVARSMMQIAEMKDIKFLFEKDIDDYRIQGDYGRLRQMFITVMDNAIKFTPEGGAVTIKAIKIGGGSNGESHGLQVSISDTGKGIGKAELESIYDRFYKEGRESGTGLGLSIMKQIADRHDIKVEIDSKVGVGTEFIFTFVF